jgi:hypothetical protein
LPPPAIGESDGLLCVKNTMLLVERRANLLIVRIAVRLTSRSPRTIIPGPMAMILSLNKEIDDAETR